MVTVCLGWGSLIWDPQGLPIRSRWFTNGPFAKVEFTRQSNDNRITLVINEHAKPVQTLWAVMTSENLEEKKESLRKREGNTKPHHISDWSSGEPSPTQIFNLAEWAKTHGANSVIWTALPSRYAGEDNRIPTIAEVLAHLQGLTGASRTKAEHYIRRAPRQIDTNYRREIEAALGWAPRDE